VSKHIVFYSLGTPLPLRANNYLNATRGNLYSIEKSPQQVGPPALVRGPGGGVLAAYRVRRLVPVRREHAHVCLRHSAGSHGVAGVTQSGIDAAKAVLNCRTRDILTQNGASLTFLPSEDVSQWPEYLRRKMERGDVAREDEEREV